MALNYFRGQYFAANYFRGLRRAAPTETMGGMAPRWVSWAKVEQDRLRKKARLAQYELQAIDAAVQHAVEANPIRDQSVDLRIAEQYLRNYLAPQINALSYLVESEHTKQNLRGYGAAPIARATGETPGFPSAPGSEQHSGIYPFAWDAERRSGEFPPEQDYELPKDLRDLLNLEYRLWLGEQEEAAIMMMLFEM